MFRSGNTDQLQDPLPHRFSVQMGNPILTHNVMDVDVPQAHRTRREEWDDTGFTTCCHAWKRDDGFSSSRECRAAHKISFATHPSIECRAKMIRSLSKQVNRKRAINRDQFVVSCNITYVHDVINWMKLDKRIIINIFVKPLCANNKTCHAMGIIIFRAIHYTLVDKVDHGLGKRFAVQGKVRFFGQESREDRGYFPGTDIERRAIFNEASNIATNIFDQFIGIFWLHDEQWIVLV